MAPPIDSQPSLRGYAKRITQAVGVYPFLRNTKENLYWKIENWQWPLLYRIRRLLELPESDVRRLSQEFDSAGLWSRIYSEITREVTSDPAYWHGASSQQDLRALYILCRATQPKIVIETGVASGASATVLLHALRQNAGGELYSIDLSPTVWAPQISTYRDLDHVSLPREKSVGWLIPDDLKKQWHLNIGDSKVLLPKILQDTGRCDFFYHDAAHTYDAMQWEYQTVWPFVTPRGILTSDDVHWSKAFQEFSDDTPDVERAYAWRGFGMARKSQTVMP